MTHIVKVRDLAAEDREILEQVVGVHLTEDQEVVISVQPASKTKLPDWLNLYAGLPDDQIAELEGAILQRDHSSRTLD
jgi:hypothetical protein